MQIFAKPICLLVTASVCGLSAIAQDRTPASDAFKASFISDPAAGRDPFFPKSARRPVPKPKVEPTEVVIDQPLFPESVQLKGISLGAGRKLALINYYTFAEGEKADLRIDGQVVHVQCVEIKDRSAIVSIKGIKKELLLRQGL